MDAVNKDLQKAQAAAAAAKEAAAAAEATTQTKQALLQEATAARDAAKVAFDMAQQELRAVEQAVRNASALLVKFSSTAMAAEAKLDQKQLLALEADRKVWLLMLLLHHAQILRHGLCNNSIDQRAKVCMPPSSSKAHSLLPYTAPAEPVNDHCKPLCCLFGRRWLKLSTSCSHSRASWRLQRPSSSH